MKPDACAYVAFAVYSPAGFFLFADAARLGLSHAMDEVSNPREGKKLEIKSARDSTGLLRIESGRDLDVTVILPENHRVYMAAHMYECVAVVKIADLNNGR